MLMKLFYNVFRCWFKEISVCNLLKLYWIAFWGKENKIYSIRLKHEPFVVFVRAQTTDCYLLFSILINRGGEYPVFKNYSPHVIIDAGANIGLATLFFRRHYPDAKIIAIEPDIENAKLFKKNTSKYGDIHLIHAGLGPDTGKSLRIKNAHDKAYSYILEEAVDGGVPEINVDEICREYNCDKIDIFKIDIEGGEKELFSRNTAWIEKTDNILIETHDHIALGASKNLIEQLKGRFFLRVRGENLVLTSEYLSISN